MGQGADYHLFWIYAVWAHIADRVYRAGAPLTPPATLLPAAGLQGRRRGGASMAPARPWMDTIWWRVVAGPVRPPRFRRWVRADMEWYPQWTHPFFDPKFEIKAPFCPHWQVPRLRWEDPGQLASLPVLPARLNTTRVLNF